MSNNSLKAQTGYINMNTEILIKISTLQQNALKQHVNN